MISVRLGLALGLAALSSAPVLAQGLRSPPPAPPVVRPGFRPLYPAPGPMPPVVRPWPYRPATFPAWPYYGGLGYYPYAPSVLYGPSYSYYAPTTGFGTQPSLIPPPLEGAGGTPSGVPVSINPELAAELTIEFPAAADVRVNGVAVPGEGKVRTMQSPPLRAGLAHTFDVKARWTIDGQAYEWERTVTLGPGERSRITVARGFSVTGKE